MHELTAGHGRNHTRRLALLHGALDHLIDPGQRSVVPTDVGHPARLSPDPKTSALTRSAADAHSAADRYANSGERLDGQ